MRKILIISGRILGILLLIVIILTLVCFEDLYNRRFSANNSNARVVSIIIDDAIKKNELIINSGEAIILGKANEQTIIVDKINNVESETSFIASAELGVIYWAVSVRDNKVQSAWSCNKDILEEKLLKPYEYGDQKNYLTVYGNRFIGYYDNKSR